MDSYVDQTHLDFCQTLLEHVNTPGGFPPHINCRLTTLLPDGTAEGELTIGSETLNGWGTVHGGALAAMADTITGAGVIAATQSVCVTVCYSMNFLQPGTGSKIFCHARMERKGRHICVMHADLTDGQDELVATSEFTFSVGTPLTKEML